MIGVTDWISVDTPPLADRPGWYDLLQADGISRVWWSGCAWYGARWAIRASAGDAWRGATEQEAKT